MYVKKKYVVLSLLTFEDPVRSGERSRGSRKGTERARREEREWLGAAWRQSYGCRRDLMINNTGYCECAKTYGQ